MEENENQMGYIGSFTEIKNSHEEFLILLLMDEPNVLCYNNQIEKKAFFFP